MSFNFVGTIQTKSASRLSNDTLVNEVRSFVIPRFRSVCFLEQNLALHQVFFVGLAVTALVRSLAQHQFMSNYSQGKVVNPSSMVLTMKYLRSCITRSARDV